MALAWFYDVTPDGVRRTGTASQATTEPPSVAPPPATGHPPTSDRSIGSPPTADTGMEGRD